MRFLGKVVVVTGAASGIGEATARLFAREGASVVVADIAPTETVAAAINKAGGKAVAALGDVSGSQGVAAIYAAAVAAFGGVDIVISNAGVGVVGTCETLTEADWDRCFAVNVKGAFLCAKHALPHFRKAGGGVILFTASIGGLEGLPGLVAYAASKAAVINLARTFALEHAHENIRANAVCPGATDTPMLRSAGVPMAAIAASLPLGRVSQPEDIAETFAFLASSSAKCITGQVVTVDSGATAGDYSSMLATATRAEVSA